MNKEQAINFLEWVVEMFPPEYDGDVRRRFTPQITSTDEKELLWIETHKYDMSNPKFYTTEEVYKMWLESNFTPLSTQNVQIHGSLGNVEYSGKGVDLENIPIYSLRDNGL